MQEKSVIDKYFHHHRYFITDPPCIFALSIYSFKLVITHDKENFKH